MALRRIFSSVILAGAVLGASVATSVTAKDVLTTSGLPIPRYVSLKSDHVNVRAGPTKDNDVAWVYTRSGLPVEITAEFENWRRVRDSEGAEGWVYHSLLSGRRTAVVTMKRKDELAPIYDSADASSAVAARLQAGVVAEVKHCAAGWCHVDGTKTYFDTNVTAHHHFYLENNHELVDIPDPHLMLQKMPEIPEGYEIARVDMVVRLRKKR